MDREVGERFTMVDLDTLELLELQVVETYNVTCQDCYFWKKRGCRALIEVYYKEITEFCYRLHRGDHKDVVFKLLRKQKSSSLGIIPINII